MSIVQRACARNTHAYVRRTIYYVWIYEHKIAINQFRSAFSHFLEMAVAHAPNMRNVWACRPGFRKRPRYHIGCEDTSTVAPFTMESLCTLNKYVCQRVMQYKAKGGGRRSFSHFSGSFKGNDAAVYGTYEALVGEVKRRRLQLNKSKESNRDVWSERFPKYIYRLLPATPSRGWNAMKLEEDMNYRSRFIKPMSGLINLHCQISCRDQTRLALYLVIRNRFYQMYDK